MDKDSFLDKLLEFSKEEINLIIEQNCSKKKNICPIEIIEDENLGGN